MKFSRSVLFYFSLNLVHISSAFQPSSKISTKKSNPLKYVDADETSEDLVRRRFPSFPFPNEKKNGLPFDISIGGEDVDMMFTKFWNLQMSFLENRLTNLKPTKTSSSRIQKNIDFTLEQNKSRGAQIYNQCFESKEFRKIRMTYYDSGHNCQVFNSLWYPRYEHSFSSSDQHKETETLPLLGIDLLAFGNDKRSDTKKFLTVIDIQPLQSEQSYEGSLFKKFEKESIAPIRQKYSSLQGRMSKKHYDETQFFSDEMIFGRFSDRTIISDELEPAFSEYLNAYIQMIQENHLQSESNRKEESPDGIRSLTQERQAAFDNYSVTRDPAKGLFEKVFGVDWTNEYMHGFLFSNSDLPQDMA